MYNVFSTYWCLSNLNWQSELTIPLVVHNYHQEQDLGMYEEVNGKGWYTNILN